MGVALAFGVLLAAAAFQSRAEARGFTLDQVLSYPFITGLVGAERTDRIAWVRTVRGVRNIWVADGPDFVPRQVTRFTEDDGQELTQLTFSPDGEVLVFVRGGDHDENWPGTPDTPPDPNLAAQGEKLAVWKADPSGAQPPTMVAEGDEPAVSAHHALAFVKDGVIWTAELDGSGARRLLFDRGKDHELVWSPDGSRLAFVSGRGDHAFVGVYSGPEKPIVFMSPSINRDSAPAWSPDSARLAFVRLRGDGGPPRSRLIHTPNPWSIMTAVADTGEGRAVWRSTTTLHGSFPTTEGQANLAWAAGDNLIFTANDDGWPHLYRVSAEGGAASLVTKGAFMVEGVALTRDRREVIYAANAGDRPGDDQRRHLFVAALDGSAQRPLTAGGGLEWSPVLLGSRAAFISADARRPPAVEIAAYGPPGERRILAGQAPPDGFPTTELLEPTPVRFTAADGTLVSGQVFQAAGQRKSPGVVFVHGGPPRQMLLGWHYMDYYSNAYAVNQYLAAHGFTVLSVNYRLGIGYGYDFQYPEHAGPAGAAEYQDVAAAGRFLQKLPGVDPDRIGIWGGSYGGYLTAMALARDPDIFKAGVDLHGVHDWTLELAHETPDLSKRFEQGDRSEALAVAWRSSPEADLSRWTAPVLLIQGDDDRNVDFHQTVDLARRLEDKGVAVEELVLPNEIHGFLRYSSWRRADGATADFLDRTLKGAAP